MASGARPSSNQRAEDAAAAGAVTGGGRKQRAGVHGPASDFCVVCGDRACSHHYYGVAACHGCKCFFWRSVKQQQQYVCRYDGNCDININHRNSCRFCRFQRCLNAGMQVEAVRMQKPGTDLAIAPKPIIGAKRPFPVDLSSLNASQLLEEPHPNKVHPLVAADTKQSDDETAQMGFDLAPITISPNKKCRQDNNRLITQLIQLDAKANELADFSENEAPKRRITLDEIFYCPEFFECYRTRVNYCVRLRKVTVEEMEFCKYRTLAKAYDYIAAMEKMDKASQEAFTVSDKVILLKNGFAPLTLFDMACGTVQATKDNNLLCLPTGITVSRNEEIISNSFISQKIINNVVDTLNRSLAELDLDHKEMAMLRAIVLLNADTNTDKKLSPSADQFVRELKDKIHAALYQHCTDADPGKDATLRFAKLLHVLPKLTLLARDLLEHIRMVHTFTASSKTTDPIFFQLFGDIFQGDSEPPSSSSSMQSPHPSPEGLPINCKIENPPSVNYRSHLEEKS